jgi:hypothetical protein
MLLDKKVFKPINKSERKRICTVNDLIFGSCNLGGKRYVGS